jgi:hypothetical protein
VNPAELHATQVCFNLVVAAKPTDTRAFDEVSMTCAAFKSHLVTAYLAGASAGVREKAMRDAEVPRGGIGPKSGLFYLWRAWSSGREHICDAGVVFADDADEARAIAAARISYPARDVAPDIEVTVEGRGWSQ